MCVLCACYQYMYLSSPNLKLANLVQKTDSSNFNTHLISLLCDTIIAFAKLCAMNKKTFVTIKVLLY